MEAEVKRLARRAISGWREVKPQRVDEQTLVYPYDRDLAWVAVEYLRTPSRVLWDLYEASAGRLEPLYEEVRAWMATESRGWFQDGDGISVRAREVREFPASGLQIQGTVKNAIIDGAQARGVSLHLEPEHPDVLLSVRGARGPLVISVDLAGRAMNERGYRLDRVEAPLRENLAAQILILARWDPRREALIDPMCGSGTFAIEAAAMGLAAPLWCGARPDLERRSEFAGRLAPAPLFAEARPVIVANDVHTPSIEAARRNVERSGMGDHILTLHGDFRDVTFDRIIRRKRPPAWPDPPPLENGLVVCNPPYGERIGEAEELGDLYAALRDWTLSLGEGWRSAFLVPDPDFERIFERRATMKKPLPNAQLKTYLYVF